IRDRVLSRLAFFARYESLLGCLAVREGRADARPAQVQLGRAVELCARSASEMEVVGELVREPEAEGFPGWLLVRDSDAGRRAQVEYADYWYRGNYRGGPEGPHRAVVGVEAVFTDGGATVLRLAYACAFKGELPRPGERFLLYPRFTDFTTDRVVRFLEQLDGDEGLFLSLLRDPEATASPLPLPKKVAALVPKQPRGLGFTASQADAFTAICGQRVTAVWGPPGTGKTHFLAATVASLAAAHARAGQPFRVLVTAFTHAAIENLLRKIHDLIDRQSPLTIGKARTWQSSAAGIEV